MRCRFIVLLMVCLLCLSRTHSCLAGEFKSETIEVEGRGINHKDAVLEALTDAVGRIYGIAIATTSRSERTEALVTVNNDQIGATVEFGQNRVDTETAGKVRRYTILKEDKDDRGVTTVKLSVEVVQYESKESKRVRIAILSVGSVKSNYSVLSESINGTTIGDRIKDYLVDGFASSHKFGTIDHEMIKAHEPELRRLSSADVSPEERDRLGKAIGAGYVLVGKIQDFSIQRYGDVANIYQARVEISYRVVDAVSGITVLSHTEKDTRQLAALPGNQGSPEALLADECKMVSKVIWQRVLETIFPMKVITVGDLLVINEGDEVLKIGQRLTVYNLGKLLRDSETHESYGYEGIEAGEATVTRTDSHVSYARVESGAGAIRPGAICRMKEGAENSVNQRKQTPKEKRDEFFD